MFVFLGHGATIGGGRPGADAVSGGGAAGAYDGQMTASAGVVLAGGRSSRMGVPKAALEWHGSTLLARTVGILARATGGPVVVVRASGQELPELPKRTVVVDDPRDGRGPVQGIAAGLAALDGRADVAFISSTDLPFLHPAFVRRVLRALDERAETDVALPVARGYPQPLAAAYRVGLAPRAERLVKQDRLRPAFLFDECAVERLDDGALRADALIAALDPDLDSVLNVNTPAEYRDARARPAPAVTVQLFGALARADSGRGPRTVRAATVDEAAAATGLTFDRQVSAALNGGQITRDGSTPLVAGDAVFFVPADGRGALESGGSATSAPGGRGASLAGGYLARGARRLRRMVIRSWVMRAVPAAAMMRAPAMAASSSATASDIRRCAPKKVMVTACAFSMMKMSTTMSTRAPAISAVRAVPIRLPLGPRGGGTADAGDVGVGGAAVGVGVAVLVWGRAPGRRRWGRQAARWRRAGLARSWLFFLRNGEPDQEHPAVRH